jgi:hypothetical protein
MVLAAVLVALLLLLVHPPVAVVAVAVLILGRCLPVAVPVAKFRLLTLKG